MTRDRSDVAHLLAFLRPHGRPLAGGLALGLASSSVALALPLVTKRLLDGLSGGAGLGPSVALLLGLLLVGGLLGLAQWVLLGSLAERIVLSARTSLVQRLFGAEVSHLTRHRTGELVTRATSDTVLLREATSQSVVEIVNGVVLLTGTLVLMAVLDPVLLGVTLAVLAVVGAGVGVLLPRVGRAHRDAQEALGELGGTLEAGLRAVRTVKANRAEGREARRVVALAERSAAHAVRAVRGEALVWTVGSNGAHLAVIAVLAVGAWRVQSGALGVSTLVAFLLYAFGLVEPATGLSTQVAQLQSGAAAARRLHDLQQIPQEPTDLPSPRGVVPVEAVPDPLLRLRSLTVHHPDAPAPALADVSLDLPRRGRIAVVGPSGAGKTTLFGVLLRFTAPTTGAVELDGVDTAAQTPQEVRRRFAYVEQETPLIAGSVRDNLLLPDPDAPEAALWEALERVGLAERVRRLPAGLDESLAGSVLSGGERQRVALARAVLHAPDVLLLDEATAQLDGLTEEAVHAVLADLARDRLVVTIAHRLSTVLDADEVVLLDGGRVRARGRHDDLVRDDELYRRLAASMGLVPA